MSKNAIYLSGKTYETIDQAATAKKMPKASYLTKLVEDLDVNNENLKTVVLQIPINLLSNNRDDLEKWLYSRAEGIIEHFYGTNS